MKKYKILSADVVRSLVEFLDEVQFDAAKEGTADDMHKVNFCNWAIQELLNSHDGIINKISKKKPKPKSRTDYIDETFLDWNLPEMSDEEFEKLVDNFDNFLRAWEREYMKNNPQKKSKKRKDKEGKEWKPKFSDVVQHCSLDEIKEMLLDDPELTDAERFELYYGEHERVQAEKNSFTLDEISKRVGIGRYKPPTKNDKKK